MKLFAIRHTSVAVPPGVCYGQTDVGVAETFNEEYRETAKQLQNIRFSKIYCSPLSRCKILAEQLFPGHEIIYDNRLKELNFGDWEMKSWDDIYSEPDGKNWMDNYQILPTQNGESYPEMLIRVNDFFEEMKLTEAVNSLIVAHAGVIRILKSIIENEEISELFMSFKPAYGSVTQFEF